MDMDPTVLCVNAYNNYAFPHTANDPTKLYRTRAYPYYGWMTNRRKARMMLDYWAPFDLDDVRHYSIKTGFQENCDEGHSILLCHYHS